MSKIIGIDLGTTNSCVAVMEGGESVVIPNAEGNRTTPSVVAFSKDGERMVGQVAKRQAITNPDRTIMSIKREMGTNYKVNIDGKAYTPQEISAMILQKLKADAEAYLGQTVTEAVITVPAYFTDAQRQATKDAGRIAGLDVKRIINEPTAAAVAYGVDKEQAQKVMVYDLGGGTFDVSILELFENILEVRAVAGDNFLGGEDFTEVLEKRFYEKMKLDPQEFNRKTLAYIRKQAELCKLGFSDSRRSVMRCVLDGETKEMEIDMADYEAACEPLLERIRKPVKRSLSDAGIKLSDIDVVVMVGGATRMPLIKSFISKLFRKFPASGVNPDEAVAMGAAIQAAMKERKESIKEVILTDVCSFTLGTEVVMRNSFTGEYEGGHFCPIIERNTVIPASRRERFYTVRDDQTKITIQVLQGESRFAANNLLLGDLEINVPKNQAGKEAVDVTYTYDINSILEVEVEVVSTGKKYKQIIKGEDNHMTDQEIEERMKELSYLKLHPRDQEENKLLLLRCERIYEESLGEVRQRVEYELQRFEGILNTRDTAKIALAREALKETLEEIEQDWE